MRSISLSVSTARSTSARLTIGGPGCGRGTFWLDLTLPTTSLRSPRGVRSSLGRQQVGTLKLFKQRAETLYGKNAASKAELDQRTLAYDQALSTEQSAIDRFGTGKEPARLYEAPRRQGRHSHGRQGEPGQVVGSGTPVVTVAMDGEKEVKVAVRRPRSRNFVAGAAVKIRFWSQAGHGVDGTVREVAAAPILVLEPFPYGSASPTIRGAAWNDCNGRNTGRGGLRDLTFP